MDDYRPESNNIEKKKLLIPLIMLLFCMVTLVASAYAYSSALESNTDIDTHSYEISLDDVGSYEFTDTVDLVYNTTIINGTPVSKTYTLDSSADNTLEFSVYMINARNTNGFTIDSITVDGLTDTNVTSTYTVSEWNTDHYECVITFNIQDNSKPISSNSIPITVTINTSHKA